MDKRTFLKSMAVLSASGVTSAYGMDKWIDNVAHVSSEKLAEDEVFWEGIRKGYRLKPDYINLENGYYCFLPQAFETIYFE